MERRMEAPGFGRALALASAGVAAALSLAAAPVTASAAAVGDARLNGFWNIDESARREAQATAKADLTPLGQEISKELQSRAQERIRRGEPVALAAFMCGLLGVPFIIGTSEPWLLVVTPDEVTQIAERYLLTPRRIYTDGRTLPDVTKMPPSSSGYSVGHWEGKELVVETRGIRNAPGISTADGVQGGLQGGGLKGPDTVLVERVKVDDAGNRLSWRYEWTDPKLMTKTLTYTIMYDRAPEHTYAMTQYCDPNEEPGKVVEPPPQEEPAK